MSDIRTTRLAAALTMAGESKRRAGFDSPREWRDLVPLLEDCIGERLFQLFRGLRFNQAVEWKQACTEIFGVIDMPAFLKQHAEFDLSVVFAALVREILMRLADRFDHLEGLADSEQRRLLSSTLRVGDKGLLTLGLELDEARSLDPFGWERNMLVYFAGFESQEINDWLAGVSPDPEKACHPSLVSRFMERGLEPV